MRDHTSHNLWILPELTDLISTENIVQKYLPKQADIDKILKVKEKR